MRATDSEAKPVGLWARMKMRQHGILRIPRGAPQFLAAAATSEKSPVTDIAGEFSRFDPVRPQLLAP